VVAGERRITYAELDRAASALAGRLRDLGVARGDRVALLLANGAPAAVAIYGVLRAGAAFTPLNPTIKREKLAYVLANCGAVVVICDGKLADLAHAACAGAPSVRHLLATGAPRADALAFDPLAAEATGAASAPVASGPGSAGAACAAPAPPADPPLSVDLAAIVYTSGSTGAPKGVTLTHANMAFAAGAIVEYLAMTHDDRILCVVPLSFDYGLYQLLMCVRVGATLVLEPGFTFPGRVVALLEREQITGLPGVPTIFQVLTSLRGLAERELPELRFLTNTAAALSTTTIAALRATFPGARLYSMYGLTECKRVSYLPPDQLDVRPESVGIPIPGTEVWIEDAEGRELGPGEVGELIVRGAHVMQGYWNDPHATAQRLRPGRWPWERVLATGDLFRRDADGYLFFVGRTDDIIKSRGEKVAPREVEEVLHGLRGVRAVAVVGEPDALLGEAICAYVVAAPGERLDPAELRRACAERLEDYMVPTRIELCAELPTTANGKVDRRALAQAGAR
jgi:amino acid adenylation domain-containing protein